MRMCPQVDRSDTLSGEAWRSVIEHIDHEGSALLDTQRARDLVRAESLMPASQHATFLAKNAAEL